MSLAKKTIYGLFWTSFSYVLIKLINFIITVILARILEPKEFGLFALGLSLLYFFEISRDLGIGTALIYKKENIEEATNTAFFLLPFVAITFYVISYFAAPLISDFFGENELIAIIRVLSLTFVISSFGSLPFALLDKNLEFKKQAYRLIIPKIIYGVVTIILAILGFGVWSLVFGSLIFQILSTALIWLLIKWKPSFIFNKKTALELLRYGKQVAWANIIVFLISLVDVSFVGKLLDTSYVGYYSIALGIAGLITNQISSVITRVMFPVYSIIKENTNHLKRTFVKTIKYVSILSIPTSFGIFAISEDFINVVYGPKWLPAVAALQVLCFYGLFRSLLGTTENLYLAAGKPEVRTKLNLLQLALMAALMYPLTMSYGIMGTAVAAMVPSLLVVFLTFREAGKIINENFMYIAKPLLPSIAGSVLMTIVIWAWQYVSGDLYPLLRLGISVVMGAAVYAGYLWFTRRELFYEIRDLMGRK